MYCLLKWRIHLKRYPIYLHLLFKHDDETYCEGVSCQIDEYQKGRNENSSAKQAHFPLNSTKLQNLSTRLDSQSNINSAETAIDDSVAFVKCLNEVITIEESQPTQELYKHIVDIKEELKNRTSPEPVISTRRAKSVAEIQKLNFNCADCEEVNATSTGNYVIIK